MKELNRTFLEADAVIFVSPIYYFDFNAQLKAVIDRFYANNEALMGKRRPFFTPRWPMKIKKTASGANASFNLMADYLGWEIVGRLNVGGCSTADDLHEEDLTAAYELGKNL